MNAIRELNLLSNDPEELTRLWHVLPKPPIKRDGWLVFTGDFLLEMLQGKYGDPEAVKRTWPWRLLKAVLVPFMAVSQAVVMFVSCLPVVSWFMLLLVQFFGRNYLGFFLRSCYWKTKLKKLGQCTLIDQGVDFWGAERTEVGHTCLLSTNVRFSAGAGRHGKPGSIIIGDYVFIGPSSLLSGDGQIRVGDFVGFSAGVHVYSATHVCIDCRRGGVLLSMGQAAPADRQYVQTAEVEIGDYAFLGCHALIMPGTKVGRGSVVHAYTEVRGSFPPFANLVGPGRAKQNGWRRPLEQGVRCDTNLGQVPLEGNGRAVHRSEESISS